MAYDGEQYGHGSPGEPTPEEQQDETVFLDTDAAALRSMLDASENQPFHQTHQDQDEPFGPGWGPTPSPALGALPSAVRQPVVGDKPSSRARNYENRRWKLLKAIGWVTPVALGIAALGLTADNQRREFEPATPVEPAATATLLPGEEPTPGDTPTPTPESTPTDSAEPTPEVTPEVTPEASSTPAPTASEPAESRTQETTAPVPTRKPAETVLAYGKGKIIIDLSLSQEQFASSSQKGQIANGVVEALGLFGVQVAFTPNELKELSKNAGHVFTIGPAGDGEPTVEYASAADDESEMRACISEKAAKLAIKILQPTDYDTIYLSELAPYRYMDTPLGKLSQHTIWNGIFVEDFSKPEVQKATADAIRAIRDRTDPFAANC